MKIIRVLIVLAFLSGPLMAEESVNVVTMGEFDVTSQAFSFGSGELVTVVADSKNMPDNVDFFIDLPNGLGMNNGELGGWFSGDAMIVDLGDVPLEEDSDIPGDGFAPYLSPEEIIVGHSYLVQTVKATQYGKFRIVDFDSDEGLLTFSWINLDN